MKIALATSFPADMDHPRGGVEAVSVNLVRALARQGDLDLHVVTVDRRVSADERTTRDGVTIHRLPWAGGGTLANAVGRGRRQMHRYLDTLKPDLVHAHDTYGLMVKGYDASRVFTVHGFIHADTRVSGTRLAWLRSLIWRRVEQAGWADQPHIISISPYVRERLSPIVRGRIHDIDNPINESFFDINVEIANREREGMVFSAALICRRKNTLALVEAIGRLKDDGVTCELRLAGDVSEPAYGETVRQRIAALGLGEQVRLMGRLSSEQVKQELAAAGVFVLVSLEENSPMGIEEAMAAGVPVVASNRCGMPYMVRDGESGYLVEPHDPREIADRLGSLVQDAGLRAAMGVKGREIARDRFHPDVVARRTREVYRRAIEDSPRGAGHVL